MKNRPHPVITYCQSVVAYLLYLQSKVGGRPVATCPCHGTVVNHNDVLQRDISKALRSGVSASRYVFKLLIVCIDMIN